MKRILLPLVLAIASGAAFAHNCPNEMKVIDAKLATNPKLSDADAAKVKQLRADGEAAHKAGKHDESHEGARRSEEDPRKSETARLRERRPAEPGVFHCGGGWSGPKPGSIHSITSRPRRSSKLESNQPPAGASPGCSACEGGANRLSADHCAVAR